MPIPKEILVVTRPKNTVVIAYGKDKQRFAVRQRVGCKYPGVSLSKNTVSVFLNDLGKAYSKIVRFMRNRTASVSMNHHLLVDGTLKSNESKVNSLSDFSYKAKIQGSRDISILYAFDLESMELVSSKCFPGNMLDFTSYSEFISENCIHQGILIGDKGFPSSAASEEFISNPDLHYMNPIKRNSKLAERHKGKQKQTEGMRYCPSARNNSLWLRV